MKDAAQALAKVVAKDVLGAAETGSTKVFVVVSIAIFQRRNPRPTHAWRPSHAALGRHVKDKHVKDVTQDLAFGCLGGACPPRHTTTTAATVFAKPALSWGRNWAAQWHFPLREDYSGNRRATHQPLTCWM